MKKFTCYYKRLKIANIRIAALAIIVSIFFLPSFVPFEKLGNNMFTVILNNQNAGVVSAPEEAEQYVIEARRRIAAGSWCWLRATFKWREKRFSGEKWTRPNKSSRI